MAGQAGVDLGLQVVVDALVDRAVFVDHRHLGVRRLDGQLATHAVGGIVDQCVFQERHADRVQVSGEALQAHGGVVRLLFARLAVGDAGFGVLGARLGDENANADARRVLLGEQIGQVVMGGVGNGYSAHVGSSQTCGQVYANPAFEQSPSI